MTTKADPEPETAVSTIEEAPESIVSRKITHTDTGLVFAEDTTFDEWQDAYTFYDRLHERGRWWLGDCIRFAEGKWPDRYTQAIEMTGLSYSRLTTLVSVCSRIDQGRRRKELSFGMHELVAYLPYQKADYLLDRAIKEKWDRDELADAVAKAKGEPTRAEKKAAKEQGKNGTVKNLPPAAKPTIDTDAQVTRMPVTNACVWNGYPVSTRDGLLFAGDELAPMAADESDRCAHHFGFANAEAMVNHLAGLKQAEPATPETASKPQDAAPVTTPPKEEPTPTAPNTAQEPEYTQHEPNQALALERAEAAINRFIECIPTVDWENVSPLARKKWLSKNLKPIDDLIDRIQKTL